MKKRITIDPITRLEGHGKIEIFLDDKGNVSKAFLQIPELRGFEKFCEGRPAEEMPRITTRICGVCPTAHHIASTKTLDDLYRVKPTATASLIRELLHYLFMLEDHMLHFYFLGGPDFIVGPDKPADQRNILGVVSKVGEEIAGKVIAFRKECRSIMELIGGKAIHPVCGLPGGVSKGLNSENRKRIAKFAEESVEFCLFSIRLFKDIVLRNKQYLDLMLGNIYKHETYYMGMVDADNKVNFYDGVIRIVSPEGKEFAKFQSREYLKFISEKVEPSSYGKLTFLKEIGWKGFCDGEESGVYRVAPLARLNVADGMATPLAQKEYEEMFEVFGSKPVHNTLAFHWARLIETVYAAEWIRELSRNPLLTDKNIRNIPCKLPEEGVGAVEAPRGLLIHHYKTDSNGIIKNANMIVATQNNTAAINMSIERAAKSIIKNGVISEGLLNMVEMAFRAYDPCFACSTHFLPGMNDIEINIYDCKKKIIKRMKR